MQNSAAGNFCPNCGAAYEATRYPIKVSKKVILISVAAFVLATGGIALAVNIQHTNQVNMEQESAAEATKIRESEAAASAEATKTRESEAAKASASAAKAKQAADDSTRTQRKVIVKALEDSVLKDAQERATTGVLTGPITLASCTPLGGGSTDDLTSITGTFECIAVNKTNSDGSSSGYRFSATVNWNAASYSWHLGS
ncbi:hypothetical protein GCM10017710_35360 [Arthrobacter ramosus]